MNKFKEKNIGMKFLIVVGTYLIGKERVWSHIAQTFKMKVWMDAKRREAFDLIYSEENGNHAIKEYVCDAPEEAQLHILPLQNISYPVGDFLFAVPTFQLKKQHFVSVLGQILEEL